MTALHKVFDPIVDSVREARSRISESVGNDPTKLIDYYQKMQEEFRDRLVPEPVPESKSHKTASTDDAA